MVDHLRDGQHLVMRSTVYPGVTALVERLLADHGKDLDVTFCPERIAEGQAMEELHSLPQIVSGRTPDGPPSGRRRSSATSPRPSSRSRPEEAELAKLFTNTWRYIKFAAANQLYMIANDHGLDFERIRARHAPRTTPAPPTSPAPGFAAGPCLLKDTMQLAAFNKNNFLLGPRQHAGQRGPAPATSSTSSRQRHDLSSMTVGMLGMAFKGESDDIRSSLSYKLKRLLQVQGRPGALHRPLRHRRPRPRAARRGARRRPTSSSSPRPTRAYALAGPAGAGRRHLEHAHGQRVTRVSAHDVSRPSSSPSTTRARTSIAFLDRVFESITMPCEVLAVYDTHEDTTRPAPRGLRGRDEPRLVPTLNTYGTGPANALRYGIDHAEADVIVVTMADGSDDPQQIEALAHLVERGVVVAAASRYARAASRSAARSLKRIMSRAGGPLALLVRPGRHPRRHQLLQGLRPRLRPPGRHRADAGFELGLELVAKARRYRLPVAELPTIWLDRTVGQSNFQVWSWMPRYLRWYRYAFGPRFSAQSTRSSSYVRLVRPASSAATSSRSCSARGHTVVGHRQPLQVRQGGQVLRRRTPTTGWSRATPRTSTS